MSKLSPADILIAPSPVPCEECATLTYFALFREWSPKNVCPVHLLPLLRKGSYTRLLVELRSVIYSHVGSRLFEPQQAYWETLPDEQKWVLVGKEVHARAQMAAEVAVQAMRIEREVQV